MKQIIGTDVGSYSFNTITKQITLTGLSPVTQQQLLLITNTTRNVVVYQFNNPALSASIAGNVITLTASLAGMTNSDSLQIIIDYQQQPVAVSNFPANQPVSVASLPLPSNAAQETGGHLASIDGKLTDDGSGNLKVNVAAGSLTVTEASVGVNGSSAPVSSNQAGAINPSGNLTPLHVNAANGLLVDGSATTQPVSATALPLPTGASTSVLQTTGNASLNSIDTKTPALGQALAAGSTPVVLTAAQVATLTPLSTVAVTQPTGTNLHTVVDSGSVSVSNFPATQPISGSVSVSNFPATQPVSGTVTANQGAANTIANSWPVEITDGTNVIGTPTHPVKIDPTGTTTQPVSGTVAISGTVPVSGSVSVSNFPATQPVSGTVTANVGTTGGLALDATLTGGTQKTKLVDSGGTNVATVSAAGAVKVDGSAVTQPISGTVSISGTSPVSGTVTADQGAANTAANSWPVEITDGTNTLGTPAHPIKVDPTGTTTQPVSGTVAVSNFPATQPVSGTVTANAGTGSFTVAQATAANLNATVTQQSLTKGTQGANGLSIQALKDAGRNVTNYFMNSQVVSTATETLQSLTGYKSGVAVAATTTPAVVTTGKIYRIQRIAVTYVAIATAGSIQVNLRANLAGTVVIGSPLVSSMLVGAGAATAGVSQTAIYDIPGGMEFAAGTGIGITVQGIGATGTAAAVGYAKVSIEGYEY